MPKAVAASVAVRRMPPSNRVTVAIGLPLVNRDELKALLDQIVDPHSPVFRHYLTPAQFTERFGPSESDYRALISFLEAHGLSITGTHPNRMILDVGGTAAAIESAFHVNMLYWRHAERGEFFAPDREPSLDTSVPVLHISGLDNFTVPRPINLKSRPLHLAHPLYTGSGPMGLFNGADYRKAYTPGVTLDGTGQTVGLLEFDAAYPADIANNFQHAGQTPIPVTTILFDGANTVPGPENVEVTLDIMMAAYMAPGLSSIIVYQGGDFNDALNRMVTDNLASQLSSSWTFGPIGDTTLQIFTEMIAQGQSFFQASGDSGAYTNGIAPPVDVPYVTAVGGTELNTAGPGGPWQSENAWADSGGGVSTFFPIPDYQQTVNTVAAGGSATLRNIPDVAMLATEIFLICDDGHGGEVDGTSASAPLWAGFMALVNQQADANETPAIGFANPPLYAIGAGSSYLTDLHDITTGGNGFNALAGFDLATGWGSPTGQPLINKLTGSTGAQSFSLAASAPTLAITAGSSANITISISPQNGFTRAVNLTVSGLPDGVTASFNPAAATSASTLTFTAAATAASSTSTVTITGTAGSLSNTAQSLLTVNGIPGFTMSPSSPVLSIPQGASGNRIISITPQNGFTGTVTLAATTLPIGVTATFTPPSTTSTSTLKLSAAPAAALGTSTVFITGTSGSLSSTTSVDLTVTPQPVFTLTASPASLTVLQGASATSTIAIVPQNGFNGGVTLTASGIPAGVTSSLKGNTLTLTATNSAALGSATITITGTSGSLSSTATIALTVAAPPSFTLTASPASLTVLQGASATSTITIVPHNGFTAAVALTASNLPAGVTASFTASTLTLTATTSAALGSATITITGTSGSLSNTATIALTVAAPATFTLTASPAGLTVLQGSTATSTIAVVPHNGFNSAVTFAASGLPTGVTASFTNSTLTLTASTSAALGSATITITGTSGTLSSTATIALTVTAPPSFTLTASPARLTVLQGSTAASTIAVVPHNGFTGAVTLTASGLPAGVTASFTNSTLTLTATNSATISSATVTITGTSGTLSSTATIALTVTAAHPSFTLTASPASLTILQGSTAVSTIAILPHNGFTAAVTLTASGLPKGVTATFSAVKSGASTLTLAAAKTAAAGASTITITGTSGALNAVATIALTVTPPSSVTLTVTPATLSVPRASSAAAGIALSGFTGAVTLSASGLPPGVTATFSPVTSGKSSVNFLASTSAATGPSTITITGKSGSLTATASVSLTVVAPTHLDRPASHQRDLSTPRP